MDLGGFLRLALSGGSPETNPLAQVAWRRQRRASQTGMLTAAVLFISAMTVWGKTHLHVRGEFLAYLFFRWSLAEFFWIWMAADHLFSTVMGWKKRRAFDDLRLSSLTPSEIAIGFLGPALGFLMIGNTIHCLVDATTPFGRGVGLRSSSALLSGGFEDFIVWRLGMAVGFWFSAFGTIVVASTWSYRIALASTARKVHGDWFGTLVRQCLMLGTVDFCSLLSGFLLASAATGVIEVFHFSRAVFVPTLVGGAFVFAAYLSGFLKIWFLGAREWTAAVYQVEEYIEPEVEEDERKAGE